MWLYEHEGVVYRGSKAKTLSLTILYSADPISKEEATSNGPAPKELLHDHILPEGAAWHLFHSLPILWERAPLIS